MEEQQNGETNTVAKDSFSRRAVFRCLAAFACSHLAAPYAAARVTIRFLLEGRIDWPQAAIATVVIACGAALTFRQLVNQPGDRKRLYGLTALLLWIVVAFVQLAVAVDSNIARPILGVLWALGTMWVPWTVWGYGFFRARGIVIGSCCAILGASLFWSLVDIAGMSGDARVEFVWRKYSVGPSLVAEMPTSGTVSPGNIIWHGYLGAERTAKATGLTLDADWEKHPPQEVWRSNCGAGWSSFAATDEALFTQEQILQNGEFHDAVTARNLTTGELIWASFEESTGFKSGLGGDGPRATPTLYSNGSDSDSTRLFTIGPTGLLQCLKASDGNIVWRKDLAKEFPGENLPHGVCASPLVVGQTVIVAPPSPGGPCLAAFDINNGDLVWRCESDWQSSYASPMLLTICEQPVVVLHASPGVVGVNPSDGSVMWQVPWTNEWDNNATQPLQPTDSPNDLIIATGYRGGAARLTFSKPDDHTLKPTIAWETRKTMKTKFCGMTQFGNILVGLDNGILCGVNLADGQRLWKNGRYGHGQLLQVDENLLIIGENGDLHLLRPDRTGHNPLSRISALDRKTWNHPAFVGDRLILRNDQEIVCFKMPQIEL